MDYTTLVADKSVTGSIRHWTNHAKLDAESILTDAQSYIYGALRAREMKTSATLALALGDLSVALPPRYLDPLLLRIPSIFCDLDQATERYVVGQRTYTNGAADRGVPANYAVFDEAFQFDCAADAAYVLTLVYYRTPAPLAPSNQTNFLTSRYPKLLRAACQMEAGAFMDDDDRYGREKAKTDELLARANVEQDFALRGIT